jgi:hypothetical protein
MLGVDALDAPRRTGAGDQPVPKPIPDTSPPAYACVAAASAAQYFLQRHARRADGRDQAERDAGGDGDRGRYAEDAPIEGQLDGGHRGRHECFEELHGRNRECHARDRTEPGEDEAFHEQLTREAAASGAQCGPEGHFALPHGASGE